MNNNIFDNDYSIIKRISLTYLLIALILILIMNVILLVLQKENYYENHIEFINSKEALILIDKMRFSNNNKIIYLNDISYDYSIEKIEEKDEVYLITIAFSKEVILNTNKYRIFLENESLLKYIKRIIEGEQDEKNK